jgi:hypothetical protein
VARLSERDAVMVGHDAFHLSRDRILHGCRKALVQRIHPHKHEL